MASPVKNLLFGVFSGLSSGISSKAAAVVASSLVVGLAVPLTAQAQTSIAQTSIAQTLDDVQPAEAQPPAEAPGATRTVQQSDSSIGIAAGQALMSEAEGAIAQQNYSLASEKLTAARKALNDVSTYYQNLNGVFVGIDSRVTSDLRALALQAAEVRDQASYQLAVVHRAQGNPELAIPLLVEVVQSQQPTRELGQRAYQQLFELGFVGVAYTGPTQAAPASGQ
jgi:hypothetical protein